MDLRDLCDHEESVDLLPSCKSSEREVGIGTTISSAGTGTRGRLIATTGSSRMSLACC